MIRCDVEITEGNPSRCYYVDPTSESVVAREGPQLGVRMPSLSWVQLATAGLVTITFASVAEGAGVGWEVGVAAFGLLAVPASSGFGEAHANSLVLAAEYDAARTVDEANDEIIKKTAEQNVRQARADESRAKTLVEETLDGDDPSDVRDVLDVTDVDDVLAALERRKDEKDAEREVAFGDD